MADLRSRIAALSPAQRARLESRVAGLVAGGSTPDRIGPRDRSRPTPLGIAQQREWAISRLRGANNVSAAFRVEGEVDLDLLGVALTELLDRHEVLRSTVEIADGGVPVQVVRPTTPVPTPVTDLSGLTPAGQLDEVRRICRAALLRPFEPQDCQRLRFFLLRLAPRVHVAMLVTDHAASDAWSLAILIQEIAALYGSDRGDGSGPPRPPIQFGDFAAWQRDQFDEAHIAGELRHWRQTLSGIPGSMAMPADRPYPGTPTYAGAIHGVDLPPGLVTAVRQFCDRENASLFPVLLAASSVLLYRLLDQGDLVIGSLVSGRTRLETEGLIGCFANPLPLRMRVTDDQTLREVVTQARDTLASALDHQDLPYDRLVDELGLGRESAQTSLSRMWINVIAVPARTLELPGLRFAPSPVDLGLASVDLTLSAFPQDGRLRLHWQYMTELFDADTVALLADQFQTVLHRVVTAADGTVGDVEFAPAAPGAPSAGGVGGVPDALVELFERRFALAPYAPALVCDGVATCYADLSADATRLARRLRALGVRPGTPVGVLVDRSRDLAVAIVAVLMAGGACLPLDPGSGPQHATARLADAGAGVLVTRQRLAAVLAYPGPARTVLVDAEPAGPVGDADQPVPEPETTTPAWYGSGTPVDRGTLASLARDVVDRLGLGAGDRVLQFAPPGSDQLVEELLPTWLAGGAVVIPGHRPGEDELDSLVRRERLTVLRLPTGYWQEWVRRLNGAGRGLPGCLRLVIVHGEPPTPEALSRWQRLGVPLLST